MKHQDTGLLEKRNECDRKNRSPEWDEKICINRMVNNDPKITTAEMKANLTAIGAHVSKSTITQTLIRVGLKVCCPQKMPLLKKNHLTTCFKLLKDFLKKPN